MVNVTYLLGAGASHPELPLVSGISESLENFAEELNKEAFQQTSNEKFSQLAKHSKQDVLELLIKDIKWLKSEIDQQVSIDTYAKKLFTSGNINKLKKLKAITTVHFIFIQCFNQKVAGRYDNFWATILGSHSNDIPKNIRILSWNYDFLLEKSYADFYGNSNFNDIQSILNCHPSSNSRVDPDNFGVYKLNGTTTISEYDKPANVVEDFSKIQVDRFFIEKLALTYLKLSEFSNDYKSNLKFSWEPDQYNIIENAKQAIKKTNILVVIGYSFPPFNREVDRQLINHMTSLEKIHIEDPKFHEVNSNLSSALQFLGKVNIEKVNNFNTFYSPYGL